MRYLFTVVTLVLTVAVAACDSTPPTITPAPDEGALIEEATLAPDVDELAIDVLNSQVAVGLERVAFNMTNPDGSPVDPGSEATLVFYKVSELSPGQNQLQKSAEGSALYFGESMPHGGSWVVYNDFDTSGSWYFDVSVTNADGTVSQGRGRVEVAGRIDTPRLGQTPPTTDTPKLTDGAALADLTSDPDPDEALYQMTVGEAIESGKPTLVLFASPGHCANEDCAATLAAVRRIARQKAGELNVIHIESRDLADPTQMSATAKAWGLPSEPWTFLFDNRGFLVARVEGPVEQVELGLLIDQMVKQ